MAREKKVVDFASVKYPLAEAACKLRIKLMYQTQSDLAGEVAWAQSTLCTRLGRVKFQTTDHRWFETVLAMPKGTLASIKSGQELMELAKTKITPEQRSAAIAESFIVWVEDYVA